MCLRDWSHQKLNSYCLSYSHIFKTPNNFLSNSKWNPMSLYCSQDYMFWPISSFSHFFPSLSLSPTAHSSFPQEVLDSLLFLELTKPPFQSIWMFVSFLSFLLLTYYFIHSFPKYHPMKESTHGHPFFHPFTSPLPFLIFFIVFTTTYVVHISYLLYYTVSTWR